MKTVVDLVTALKTYFLGKDTTAKQAVEANIAPVETDATSASQGYVVGAQLILNDVLYDVTATITAGDALVVGTNISAADDVTSQIADVVGVMATLQTAVNGKASKDVIDTEYETIGSAALYPHTSGTNFYGADNKLYKATADIAVGDTLTVNTNCVLDNVVSALNDLKGGSSDIFEDDSSHDYVVPLYRTASEQVGIQASNNANTYRLQLDVDGTVKLYKSTDGGTTWTLDNTVLVSSDIANNLTTSTAGKALDATQGLALSNKHKVSSLSVSTSGWTADTTSQSGTTLYKKSISLSHVYTDSPSVDIGAASGSVLPTAAQQTAYDLLQYATINGTTLYLYASDIPTAAFYINVEGVD